MNSGIQVSGILVGLCIEFQEINFTWTNALWFPGWQSENSKWSPRVGEWCCMGPEDQARSNTRQWQMSSTVRNQKFQLRSESSDLQAESCGRTREKRTTLSRRHFHVILQKDGLQVMNWILKKLKNSLFFLGVLKHYGTQYVLSKIQFTTWQSGRRTASNTFWCDRGGWATTHRKDPPLYTPLLKTQLHKTYPITSG